MIDNEIIKANDILDKFDFFNQRAWRELWNEKTVSVQDEDIRDREKDIKFLKDLINRQKADIEMLKKTIEYQDICIEACEDTKSAAYKECLAKVKNYIKTHCNPYGKPDFDYDTSIKILNFIDNFVKEMTEVETNQRKEDENNGVHIR